jgi:hypothetical protein
VTAIVSARPWRAVNTTSPSLAVGVGESKPDAVA